MIETSSSMFFFMSFNDNDHKIDTLAQILNIQVANSLFNILKILTRMKSISYPQYMRLLMGHKFCYLETILGTLGIFY